MIIKLKNKLKLKKILIKLNLEKFDSIQEDFSRQILKKEKTKTVHDKKILYPNEIYMILQKKDLLNLDDNDEIFEIYVNDYFDMDFLYLKIHDKFEQLTGKNIRYAKNSEDGYIIKNKKRIRLKNIIFKTDLYAGFESLIELERLQKALTRSTNRLKLYIDEIIKEDPEGKLLFKELTEQNDYRRYYNNIIDELKRTLRILNELIVIREEKQNKIKSLMIPIFSLIIPILIFLPDYLNYKKIEDDNIFKLNNWEQIAYDEAEEKLDYNTFKLISNENTKDLDIEKDYINVIKKKEELKNIKSNKIKTRLLRVKILFLIFLFLSLVTIYFLF